MRVVHIGLPAPWPARRRPHATGGARGVTSAVENKRSPLRLVESKQPSSGASPLDLANGAAGATSAQLAGDVVKAWQGADAALSPILGKQGVSALYRRSLNLASPSYPWLAEAQGEGHAMDLEALRQVLARQDSAAAEAGGGALLETFNALLAALLGPALARQLLRCVWNTPSSAPAQDDPP